MKLPILLMLIAPAFQETPDRQSDYEALSQATHQQFLLGITGLLGNEVLLKELEIVPSQVAEMKERITTARQTYKNIYAEAEKRHAETGDTDQLTETANAAYRDYSREWEKVLADVLLPHQLEQLNRLVLWSTIKSGGPNVVRSERTPFWSVLEHGMVQELVGIDESQARELLEHADKLQDDFANEMAALHDKYEAKLQENLTQEQRRKLKKLLGETPAFYYR